MTNAIKTYIATLAAYINAFKQDCKRHWAKQLEDAVMRVVEWALSKESIQEEIARAFTTRSTPMCGVLREAIDNRLEGGIAIDADNVEGLERSIEHSIDSYMRDNEFDADAIKDFDRAVQGVVSDMGEEIITENDNAMEKIVDAVLEALLKRLMK